MTANTKSRNRAYEILVQIGHACGDEDKGGRKEKLHQFFNMVAGGLAGQTPSMICAAVIGIARLAYEFNDLISIAFNVLPSMLLLLQRKNREIIKVLVAKSQADGLNKHLKSMVEGLLNWQDSTKEHFRAKVKLLLEMLVKKCGLNAVKDIMPEEHMELLTNIRKVCFSRICHIIMDYEEFRYTKICKEHKERKAAANSEETKSHRSKAQLHPSLFNLLERGRT